MDYIWIHPRCCVSEPTQSYMCIWMYHTIHTYIHIHLRSSKPSPRSSLIVANLGAQDGFICGTICIGAVSKNRDFTCTILIDLAMSFSVIMFVNIYLVSYVFTINLFLSYILKAQREKVWNLIFDAKSNDENRFE